ncbi:interleukin-8-like [Cebidichthys violaceus]|uniref:interleukin-8-like n=1 Tax=Cebidichthys violaceus TaxID=271503 RepID=UPI0035C953EC
MNTAIRCIVLLACITICTSSSFVYCRCVKTRNAVLPSLIAHVEVYEPRPYCNKKEVIVILKDGKRWCLDPKGKFAQLILQAQQKQRALRADKMNTTSPKISTTPAPALATVTPTSS